MTKELSDRLAVTAQQEGVSMNEFVVQACEFALQNFKCVVFRCKPNLHKILSKSFKAKCWKHKASTNRAIKQN